MAHTIFCTGSCQEAHTSNCQTPASHRRRIPRRNQGKAESAPRSSKRSTSSCHQRRQGEEGRSREQEEGREGQDSGQGGHGASSRRDCKQATSERRTSQGGSEEQITGKPEVIDTLEVRTWLTQSLWSPRSMIGIIIATNAMHFAQQVSRPLAGLT